MYNKVMFIEAEMESWIGPIICYMENGDLLIDKTKATKCIKFVVRYTVITNKLYKRDLSLDVSSPNRPKKKRKKSTRKFAGVKSVDDHLGIKLSW